MKKFSRNIQMSVNLISSLVVFVSNMAISFFLAPYIVEHIGVEANGFVQLANDFVNYATILVGIINSMAARFVTIAVHQGDVKKANVYYTSVFYANLALLALFTIPAICIIVKLEHIINIPPEIVVDVKWLFIFIFLNFLSGLAVPMWGTSTYITNTLYITSLGNTISSILRVGAIVCMFAFFEPKVWYIGFASFLVMIFIKVWNYVYKKKLTPELKISKASFDKAAVKELMSSGVWNALSSLGVMLLSGLDLLICNTFVGATAMGVLTLAKTIPHKLTSLSSTICSVFAPEITINYAKGDKERLKTDLKQAMNITGIIMTVPLAILFVFGDSFFKLWVPSQDAVQLQILSILTVLSYIFTCGVQVLYNVFTTVNKVKINSIMMILSGAVSTLGVLVCLRFTDWGIFAIAGVSSVVNIIRNMCYTVPFATKYIGFKWYTFFPQVGKSILSVVCILIVGYIVKLFMAPATWLTLLVACVIAAVFGFAVNIMIVLTKQERKILLGKFMSKLKRKKKSA